MILTPIILLLCRYNYNSYKDPNWEYSLVYDLTVQPPGASVTAWDVALNPKP